MRILYLMKLDLDSLDSAVWNDYCCCFRLFLNPPHHCTAVSSNSAPHGLLLDIAVGQ